MNPEIKRLVEARNKAWAEMRALSDHIAAEGREFSGEEEIQWAKGNADLDALDARLNSIVELEQRNADIEATLGRFAPSEAPAEVKVSDSDMLRSLASGERRFAEFGPEAAEKRVLSKLTAGAGANTVPVSFYDQLIVALKENSTVMAANAMLIETAGGEGLQVPTAASGSFPTAALVAEAGTIGASDPAFGQVTLGAYKYAFLTQVSSELLSDTAVNIEAFLAQVGGQALGNGFGAATITGTGSSQPVGIAGSAGFATVASATGSAAAGFTMNDCLTLMHSITRPYREGASFICNDSVVLQLRKLRDLTATTGAYLWQPSTQAGQPDLLLGKPVFTDPNMPTVTTTAGKGLAFGDWGRGVMVRIAGGVRVESSQDYAFNTDLNTFRFIMRGDSQIIDAAAARVLTYLT
jgi:HK97 family phage major capsid protein